MGEKQGTIKDVFLYDEGAHVVGSAGIVITAAGENWRGIGVRTITINECALLALSSVFPLELVASVVAIKIAAILDTPQCRIHTDCQSVQKLLSQKTYSDR